MSHNSPVHIIRKMGTSWKNWSLLTMGLYALALALPIWVLVWLFWGWNVYWLIILLILFFAAYALLDRSWLVTDADVARYLDKSVPELEESAGLLLTENNGLLAQLQEAKISGIIASTGLPHPWKSKCRKAGIVLFGSAILSAGLYLFPIHSNQTKKPASRSSAKT